MAPIERDYMLRVRMAQDERRKLEALADREGLTSSDIVRQLIRREYETKFGTEPPKQSKPKKK